MVENKRTLLISLRSSFLDNDRVYPSLAGLYLKSAMEERDLETVITDDWTLESLSKFSHVGVSVMTPQRNLASDFIQTITKHYPNIITIAGGPHANFYTNELIEEGWNHVVKGDGERVLPKIVRGEIKDKLVIDKLTKDELAEMPRPDRLGSKEYLSGYGYHLEDRISTTLLTARGCPERCTFCEDAMTPVNRTPLKKVIWELDDIVELGYKGVYIFDDIFALAPKVTEPIARAMKDRDLIYRCNGQARMMTDGFMKMLAETGCREIAFGAESGSQKILDNIQKRTKIHQNYDFVDWAHKYGVPVKLFILLGLPGEDRQTLRETEDFIKSSSAADVQVAIYMPYKGTQIRDAIDRGDKTTDLTILGKLPGGEVTGAYGIKGGETSSEVRTSALSSKDLLDFRNHLVETYRPKAHSEFLTNQRQEEDKFFECG